jgi:hypothetical protein
VRKTKKQIEDFISDYTTALTKATESGEVVCKILKRALKEIGIKDADWSLGWEEGGIDLLCFYSAKRSILGLSQNKNINHTEFANDYIRFEKIVPEVFPELKGHIETPFGLYLTKAEAKRLKTRLYALKRPEGEKDSAL